MPTLRLRDGTTAVLSRFADTPYFTFDGHQDAWLHDNDQLHKVTNDIFLASDEYDAQITRYLAGDLVLARGLPRQHPLYHEIAELGILMPLGVGAMPDWATNATRYIPFGPDLASAQGIALGRAGMGPGDDQRMMADFALLAGAAGQVDIGLTIEVTVTPGTGVAFYNPGEIQVRGPIATGLTVQRIQLSPADLPGVPDEAATAIYKAEHGGLRHRATVAAITAHGTQALAAVRGDARARAEHAETLFAMRKALVTKCEAILDLILKNTKPSDRPGNRDDINYRHYLDSAVNREAHDEYVASVAAGADRADASTAAQRRALLWLTRVSIAYEAQEPPFPNGWEALE
ncbi:MAG TPA: hypothetical protein VFC19_29890 [Candidatus Limnocylindrales bacterium]|nr:hypothetical protein [Candidatus Limnocylindrales bacterium]